MIMRCVRTASQWVVMCGGLLIFCAVVADVKPTQAQPLDSIRAEAQRAFHGPDLKGKDGPLATVGLDLARLYFEYQAHIGEGKPMEAFQPRTVTARVDSGAVTIDATADGSATALREDLKRLGLRQSAAAGRIVSGDLPIEAIPEMAALASLRSARPARAITQSAAPSSPPPSDSTPRQEGEAESNSDSRPIVWYVGAALAVILIAGGTVLFLNRRDP